LYLELSRHQDSTGVIRSDTWKDKQYVRVTRSFVSCVCFVDRCLSFCIFSFGDCVVCFSFIYEFWLPLWYIQTLRDNCIVFGTFTASRFHRSNQKRYMEGQAIQWAMENNQKGQTMIYKALQRRLDIEQHMSSPSVFSGVRVTRSFVSCVCFVDRCLSFCPF
jgi:hypothetical protein